jgi:hypothetical protein
MAKRAEKFAFVRRDPYDLSQPSLAVASKLADAKRDPLRAAKSSSYSVSERPSRDAVKRIKMR